MYFLKLYRCKTTNQFTKSGPICLIRNLDTPGAPKPTLCPKMPLKGPGGLNLAPWHLFWSNLRIISKKNQNWIGLFQPLFLSLGMTQWWGWNSEDLNGRCCLFALSNQQPLASYCSWVIPIRHVTWHLMFGRHTHVEGEYVECAHYYNYEWMSSSGCRYWEI